MSADGVFASAAGASAVAALASESTVVDALLLVPFAVALASVAFEVVASGGADMGTGGGDGHAQHCCGGGGGAS